jgi:glycosyltransferase involved in cell wall biosynthesis
MTGASPAPGPRVALDARFIGYAGIGRMVDGLWRGLVSAGADVVGLWPGTDDGGWMGAHRPPPAGTVVKVTSRPFLPGEQLTIPAALRRMHAEVHHAPNFAVPYLTRVPIVLTVHDLFPYLDRQNARSRAAGAAYRTFVPAAIRRARIIVAVSRFAARQVSETFGVAEDRLRIIEHGIDHDRWFPPDQNAIAKVRESYALPDRYLLYVGTAKRHKNLETLVDALRPGHPPLVLAGPSPDDLAQAGVKASGAGDMIALGRVSDAELAGLYGGAIALALPSLYEAVGFTALEAMACGTPVISSNGGGLPDTVGDGGLLVPAREVDAWTDAITRLADDGGLRERLGRAGIEQVRGRSWNAAAESYLEVYREAAA